MEVPQIMSIDVDLGGFVIVMPMPMHATVVKAVKGEATFFVGEEKRSFEDCYRKR